MDPKETRSEVTLKWEDHFESHAIFDALSYGRRSLREVLLEFVGDFPRNFLPSFMRSVIQTYDSEDKKQSAPQREEKTQSAPIDDSFVVSRANLRKMKIPATRVPDLFQVVGGRQRSKTKGTRNLRLLAPESKFISDNDRKNVSFWIKQEAVKIGCSARTFRRGTGFEMSIDAAGFILWEIPEKLAKYLLSKKYVDLRLGYKLFPNEEEFEYVAYMV